MKISPLWLLSPHALSCICFGAAFVWMSIVETNRSLPDLYLAIAGFAALALALISTVFAAWRILAGKKHSGKWQWLMAHVGALAVSLVLAGEWFARHLV